MNPYQDNSNDNGVAAAYADMNVTQRRIMQTISSKSEGLSEGVHIQMIHRELPSITAETLHRECAALIEDGHLYTTVDEDQYVLPRMFAPDALQFPPYRMTCLPSNPVHYTTRDEKARLFCTALDDARRESLHHRATRLYQRGRKCRDLRLVELVQCQSERGGEDPLTRGNRTSDTSPAVVRVRCLAVCLPYANTRLPRSRTRSRAAMRRFLSRLACFACSGAFSDWSWDRRMSSDRSSRQ